MERKVTPCHPIGNRSVLPLGCCLSESMVGHGYSDFLSQSHTVERIIPLKSPWTPASVDLGLNFNNGRMSGLEKVMACEDISMNPFLSSRKRVCKRDKDYMFEWSSASLFRLYLDDGHSIDNYSTVEQVCLLLHIRNKDYIQVKSGGGGLLLGNRAKHVPTTTTTTTMIDLAKRHRQW